MQRSLNSNETKRIEKKPDGTIVEITEKTVDPDVVLEELNTAKRKLEDARNQKNYFANQEQKWEEEVSRLNDLYKSM